MHTHRCFEYSASKNQFILGHKPQQTGRVLMKSFLFILIAFTGLLASAQQVELKIDGEYYYCSKNPNDNTNCTVQIQHMETKYSTCTKSNGPSHCFNSILPDTKRLKATCPNIENSCYSICTKSGGPNYCYSSCFE